MQTLERSDGCEENMCQKTTDAMIKSQHDCLVVRVCQKAYVEAQQNVQFVSDGRRIGSVQTSFCNTSECSNNRSKENVKNEWLEWERKRRNIDGKPGEKCDVVPPQQLLLE